MAEGPLVHHYAKQLQRLLGGKEVEIEFGMRRLKNLEPSLKHLRVQMVEAHGKQFRIHLSDDRIVLIHLMMWGSWRFYRRGQPWDKPRDRARAIFRTNSHEVVVFSAPVVRLLTQREIQENPRWGNLGPDPLRTDFSSKVFLERLIQKAPRDIGESPPGSASDRGDG